MTFLVLKLALSGAAAASGAFAARRSLRGATALCTVMLALVLAKYVLARVPALEPQVFPWDWYPEVEPWWVLVPTLFLFGAGLFAARRSVLRRDLLLVLIGLLAGREILVACEGGGDRGSLRGRVETDGVCRQTSGYSCAAAAAASFLHHYGVETSEREMARHCATRPGAGGTSMCGVMRGLRRKLPGRSVRITAPDYGTLPAPALVSTRLNWLLGHCIVVERVYPDRVVVMDPLVGRCSMSRERFEASWKGDAVFVR